MSRRLSGQTHCPCGTKLRKNRNKCAVCRRKESRWKTWRPCVLCGALIRSRKRDTCERHPASLRAKCCDCGAAIRLNSKRCTTCESRRTGRVTMKLFLNNKVKRAEKIYDLLNNLLDDLPTVAELVKDDRERPTADECDAHRDARSSLEEARDQTNAAFAEMEHWLELRQARQKKAAK